MRDVTLGVSEAIGLINQSLDHAFPFLLVEGEVASFKVNQNKFVFFDLKDESGSLSCFMMVYQLKFPLEDGMKVRVLAQPKLTVWGKFSLTVKEVQPVGEGSLKKSQTLLKAKLEAEGLFDASRKRQLPAIPSRVGVISSSGAAGYADFIKILESRWGGLEVILADVPVQGIEAPEQIIGAVNYLNELPQPLDVLVIIRGGGSSDDLSAFSHEDVVRAVAASRTPTIVGVGHETDISLADLGADVRAATPSNAAQLLVPDKKVILSTIQAGTDALHRSIVELLGTQKDTVVDYAESIHEDLNTFFNTKVERLKSINQTLYQLNPQTILKRGYGLVRKGISVISKTADVIVGDELEIQLSDGVIEVGVTDVRS